MSERRIYNPKSTPAWTPLKEWVELTDGSWICVWELSVPEQFQVAEAAQRHPNDPRPGANEKEASLWLLAYACRKGKEAGSERVFSDMEIRYLAEMVPEDFVRLLAAARGLGRATPDEEEKERDFTGAGASATLKPSTGASRSSAVSRKNSPASAAANLSEP